MFLASCFVGVENQITPDKEVDKRLVGVWTCVPLHETKAEADKAFENEAGREDDDIGINGYIIIGDTGRETLELVGIENFDPRDGATLIKGRNARTRKHKNRNYLLFDMGDVGSDRGQDDAVMAHYVLEYAFLDDGSLRMWFLYVDNLKEVFGQHQMEVEIENRPFGLVTIKGTSQQILDFYSDEKVLSLMSSCGRYQKLAVPKNARVYQDY